MPFSAYILVYVERKGVKLVKKAHKSAKTIDSHSPPHQPTAFALMLPTQIYCAHSLKGVNGLVDFSRDYKYTVCGGREFFLIASGAAAAMEQINEFRGG